MSDRPRHCMVVHAYYPVGETRVQRQAMALVDRGFDVDVLCLRDRGEARRETVDGVNVHRLPLGRHRDRGFVWQMVEYLVFFGLAMAVLTGKHLTRRYRAVQVHNLPDFLVFCALVPRLTGSLVILDIHDLMPEFFASKTGNGLDHPLVRVVRWQEKLSCRFASRVITVTREWQRTLGERSTDPEKVSVVMNLADPRMFTHRPRDRSGADDDLFRVIYHGTLTHRYGVDLLIRAVGEVANEIPGVRLSVLGDGDARDELVALARDLDLNGSVTFSEGMLDAATLPDALVEADLGVVPNRSDVFTDGLLPTKLLEYVAVGTPVLTARTPGVSAYFDESMVGFFEPGSEHSLAEGIRKLSSDRSRLNELSDEADRFNLEHNWPAAAADYANLIEAGTR